MSTITLDIPTTPNITLKRSEFDNIPYDKKGIYFIYGKDNYLFYIGKSSDLRERLLYSHLKGKDNCTKEHFTSFERIELYLIDDEVKIDMLEIYLINAHKPLLNKASAYYKSNRNREEREFNDTKVTDKWLPSGNIYKYRQLSKFKSIEDFNATINKFKNRYKEKFTKSEWIAFKHLTRYACKIFGVSNIKISTLTSAIGESTGTTISRRTIERMIKKAKDIGIVSVYNTYCGRQASNVYVFNRFN